MIIKVKEKTVKNKKFHIHNNITALKLLNVLLFGKIPRKILHPKTKVGLKEISLQ
jgi:hypothetical protein